MSRPSSADRVGRRPTGWAYLDDPGPVLALAHRGGAGTPGNEGLENTLTAFRSAVALGYRYLETDVHVTADGVLVACHDADLWRLTGRSGLIADLTYADVRRHRVGGAEHVPTLAEVVEAVPEARLNVDLKSAGAVPALAAFVEARALHDRLLVGCFDQRRMEEFRRLTSGRVATAATPWEATLFATLPGRVADRVTRGRVAAVQVPVRRGPVTVVTPAFVRNVHRAGKHVHVWTVDDAATISTLLDRGVDGILTDRTDILRDVLEQRGLWRQP